MNTCLICGGLEPAGTYAADEWSAHERPYRVLLGGDGGAPAFIDVATLAMAQSVACGQPQARILTLEMPG